MTPYDTISRTLDEALVLAFPPIAVCFSEAVPAGIPEQQRTVPAGCSFWEQAAAGPLATSTADHELCAVGVYTHNLAEPSPRHMPELAGVLKVMAGMEYVREEDVATIPVRTSTSKHVVYAPLASTPLPPDVVLLFADSRQGLIITEAVQQVDDGVPLALGRPACAVIPQAINTGRAALSLGCCGARAYLERLVDGVALWALPGAALVQYAERIARLAKANDVLGRFHALRKIDVAAGKIPTYAESLARLESRPTTGRVALQSPSTPRTGVGTRHKRRK